MLFASAAAIPVLPKVLYTVFILILVPAYWRYYGPANFLWFSDLALFITLAAVWLESPLLASTQALSVGLLELGWLADFVGRFATGGHWNGLSDYMFKPEIPLRIRALSLFHVVLPPLLFWLVWRLGYDGRALVVQTVFAWCVLFICRLATKPEQNINWAFAPGKGKKPWPSPRLYLVLLMIGFPVCLYLPTHLLLLSLAPRTT
jgi:hypothetical protein